MKLVLNLWVLPSLLGAAQGIFLALILAVNKRGNQKANRVLAVLIVLFSLRLLEFAGYWTEFYLKFPELSFITVSFPFQFGLLVYLYAKFLTNESYNLRWWEWLHFLPFLIHSASMMPYYVQGSEFKLKALHDLIYTDNPVFTTGFYVVRTLQIIHMLTYVGLTLVLLRKCKSRTNGRMRLPERISLKWLQNLAVGFAVLVLLDFYHMLELWIYGYKHIVQVDALILLFSAVFIYSLGYMALRQPEVYTGLIGGRNGPKYERSTLSRQSAEEYLHRLINLMETEKPYIDSDISLTDLAAKLSISSHHLSQIINDELNKNFYDFINEYRIEEAKKRLHQSEYDNLTVLSIAFDVGFNNKASFNAAFKKHTDMTPSQFRASAKQPIE